MEFQFTPNNIPAGKSFIVQKQPYESYSVLHAHKNFELNLMVSGHGKRIVGNNIARFEDDDLVLIGPEIPHSRELTVPQQNNPPECLTLFISESLINNDLNKIPELESIQTLFYRAAGGLAFKGQGVKAIENQLKQLVTLKNTDSFIAVIQLLKNLSELREFEILSLTQGSPVRKFKDIDQIKIIYNYIIHNIQETITLETASGLLNMAPGSFCRYFKKRTGKSFGQYIRDVRIDHACRMLSNTELPVAQISYESGYNNLANFNFYFKSTMKMTPSEYRKNLLHNKA